MRKCVINNFLSISNLYLNFLPICDAGNLRVGTGGCVVGIGGRVVGIGCIGGRVGIIGGIGGIGCCRVGIIGCIGGRVGGIGCIGGRVGIIGGIGRVGGVAREANAPLYTFSACSSPCLAISKYIWLLDTFSLYLISACA
jgi:hypothetical protein